MNRGWEARPSGGSALLSHQAPGASAACLCEEVCTVLPSLPTPTSTLEHCVSLPMNTHTHWAYEPKWMVKVKKRTQFRVKRDMGSCLHSGGSWEGAEVVPSP